MNETHNTIAAIGTAPGSGGIAIVRISGAEAKSILNLQKEKTVMLMKQKLKKPTRQNKGSESFYRPRSLLIFATEW